MAKKSSLKIGIILDTSLDTNEGVPQYVACIGEWLRDEGNDVHYLVGETKKRDLPNIHSLSRNISVQFNGNRTTIPLPTSRRKLKQFMTANTFDILYVQTPHHPLMAQRLIMAAPKSTIVIGEFHILPYGRLAKIGTKALGLWLRPSLKRFDKMLAVSTSAAEFEKWAFGLDAKVMPNVFEYPRFQQADAPAGSDRIKTILFLGRLVPRKGCMILLEAIRELSEDPGLPAFKVVICGKGPQGDMLKEYVKANRLDKLVEFKGYVSEKEKPGILAGSDISVFPSSAGESFGIVLLEAMAAGRAAVLAGDNPGYRSVIGEQPWLLFDPKDSHELAKKIRELLINDSKRQELAEWGSDFTRRFDVNKVGLELLKEFNKTIQLHK